MDLLTTNDQQGEYPRSYYADTATHLDRFPAAKGDLTCDVCVVGAGFTGMSTAYHLAKRGYDVIVVEAQRVGFGASGEGKQRIGGFRNLAEWLNLNRNALRRCVKHPCYRAVSSCFGPLEPLCVYPGQRHRDYVFEWCAGNAGSNDAQRHQYTREIADWRQACNYQPLAG